MERLTPRQREIMQLVAQGGSDKFIATKLGISVWTVRSHLAMIRMSMGNKETRRSVILRHFQPK